MSEGIDGAVLVAVAHRRRARGRRGDAGVDRLVLAMLEKNAAARPTLSQVKVALTAIAQARDGAVTMPPRTPPQTFAATALLDAPPPRSSSTIGLATGQTAAPVASPRRSWRWPAAVTIALAAAALVVFASRSRPRPGHGHVTSHSIAARYAVISSVPSSMRNVG